MPPTHKAPWVAPAVALLLGSHVGCHARPSPEDPAPAASGSSVPLSSARSAAAPSTSPVARAPSTDDVAQGTGPSRAIATVLAWNAAINAHDSARLAPLYADPVEIYGTKMPRARALAAKQASFAKHDHDALSSIEVTPAGHAQFDKKSTGRDGKLLEVTGYLDLRQEGGTWLIAAEGDTTTDANLERAKASRCEVAVSTLVYATREARKAVRDIEEGAKTAPEEVHPGGMFFPPEPGGTTWAVGVCEDHPDRMPCFYHFKVDVTVGTVSCEGLCDGGPVATDPTLVARMKTACK